jgi:heptosyltransferase-2
MTTPAGAELVRSDPLVHAVIVFDKRSQDRGLAGLLRMSRQLRRLAFDRAYALQRSYRTSLMLRLSGIPHRTGFESARWSFCYHVRRPRNPDQHDVHRNLSLLTGEAPRDRFQEALRLFPPPVERIAPDLADHIQRSPPYVILAPGSVWETKRWSWQCYRKVAACLIDQGYRVMLLGAAADKPINRGVAQGLEVIDLAGRTSVAEAMTMVQHAAGMVCNDSMALHLASAFHTPCVAVFCATSPAFGFGPWRNPNAVVMELDDLPCKPCARHGGRHCPTGTRACMEALRPEPVIAALMSVLPP